MSFVLAGEAVIRGVLEELGLMSYHIELQLLQASAHAFYK